MNYKNASAEERQIINGLFEDFTSGDIGRIKTASLATTDYLRLHIRENGLLRKILTPLAAGREDLDRQLDSDLPITIMDMEPDSVGARVVPFGGLPSNGSIQADRFPVVYSRVMSRRYQIDTAHLLTWNMDLRDMYQDLSLKDLMDTEDITFWNQVVAPCIGSKNTVNEAVGACQYVECGAFGRASLTHFRKGFPSQNTHLEPGIVVINNVTIHEFASLDRTAAGGDFAMESLFGTPDVSSVLQQKIVVTNKTNLVPNKTVYGFVPENYLGAFRVLKDVTLVSDLKDDYLLEFFNHELIGASVGNEAGIIRGDFSGTAKDWNTGL